jgi:hypothetical protein
MTRYTTPVNGTIVIGAGGTAVNELAAAETLNVVDGPPVAVYEMIDGRIAHTVDVYARRRASGDVQPPTMSWAGIGSVTAAEGRRHIELTAIAARIIELADMLAAR